jgi:hypothetical protein
MKTRRLLLDLLCLLLVWLPKGGFAQQAPSWPRHPTTGRVEFAGVLPWPSPALTAAQQQALVRRWYLAKLTSQKSVPLAQHATAKSTFAGLPTLAQLDSVTYKPDNTGAIDSVYDWVMWRLMYRVRLTPTP